MRYVVFIQPSSAIVHFQFLVKNKCNHERYNRFCKTTLVCDSNVCDGYCISCDNENGLINLNTLR